MRPLPWRKETSPFNPSARIAGRDGEEISITECRRRENAANRAPAKPALWERGEAHDKAKLFANSKNEL